MNKEADKILMKYASKKTNDYGTHFSSITYERAIKAMEEYRNHPAKFIPERTPKEEAERLVKVLLNDTKCWLDEAVKIAIIDQQNTITALKAANVSTVWHEEVLTILKGM